jgi:hypothetical protein
MVSAEEDATWGCFTVPRKRVAGRVCAGASGGDRSGAKTWPNVARAAVRSTGQDTFDGGLCTREYGLTDV